MPTGQHLIICRNVLIYFDRPTQERLFVAFHEALAPGGFLFLGRVESLLGRARGLFRPVSTRERIYRKPI
jgi:chemotaxis protein methyltransferase CheR